ncbi:MAG TPA: galactonate dehydratase [Acetobacteraceae bacterium]|jgi:galactonate dehydratase|nr:galactonate dehydratase [Acetobacteraceae bacterium]
MKITKVEPLMVDRFCLVRIETDQGVTGIGESGAWGQLEASAAAIRKYAEYLVGRDPRPIEHHWNVMLRANHFTGGAITGAVSAIDIALWDIKGKLHGVPVYELLGGRMRHKARLYGHVKGRTIEALVAEAKRLKAEGFTALGHLNPLLDEDEAEPYYRPHAAKMHEAIDNVRRLREAVGPEVDLCIEIHRRLTPPEAIALGRGIEPYTPMFFEDPLRPNSFDAMAWVADHIPIPVATGERFTSLYQFQTLLTRHAVEYLRPDVCLCGGITGAKKIAAIAEAHDAQIVPHNPLSPISTAACLQVAACIPNFAIQEYPSRTPDLDGSTDLLGAGLATGLADQQGGFIAIPDGPGIGLELVPDIERRFPPRPRPIRMRPHQDGSVVDQ